MISRLWLLIIVGAAHTNIRLGHVLLRAALRPHLVHEITIDIVHFFAVGEREPVVDLEAWLQLVLFGGISFPLHDSL